MASSTFLYKVTRHKAAAAAGTPVRNGSSAKLRQIIAQVTGLPGYAPLTQGSYRLSISDAALCRANCGSGDSSLQEAVRAQTGTAEVT